MELHKGQKVIHLPTDEILTIIDSEVSNRYVTCSNNESEIEEYIRLDLSPFVKKEDIIDIIINNVDIRGIDLSDYKRNFEESGIYELLCKSMNYPLEVVEEEEKTIPVTYAHIQNTCGWSKYCDVTNGNHYAIREFGHFDDNHIFNITETQFKALF